MMVWFSWMIEMIFKYFPKAYDIYHSRRTTRTGVTFRSYQLLYDELHSLLVTLQASRVLILRAENGGGRVSAKTPIYGSVHAEVSHDIASIYSVWQRVLLDESYLSIILSAIEACPDTFLRLETENLKGALKDSYESQSIQGSFVFYITGSDKAVFYASVAFKSPVPVLDARIRDRIRISQRILARLLE